jgi:hypothetical protein
MEQSDFVMKPCQSNIKQSTQKGGNTKNKMEGPMSKKTKEPLKEGKPQVAHQALNSCITRSISIKERGGPLVQMHSLLKPSPTRTTCLKIEIACACCSTFNTLAYKMRTKLKKEGL